MSEYLIFGVSYSEDEKHIEWVLLSRVENGTVTGSSVVGHSFVVDLIKTESASFRTATMDKDALKFHRGALVHVYDDEFLATDRNATEKDNLSNLPRFNMPSKEIEESVEKMLS
jgi:hypothetical protein